MNGEKKFIHPDFENGGPRIQDGQALLFEEVIVDETDEVEDEEKTHNRENFLKRFEGFPNETVETIDYAYDLAKEAHRKQVRKTGERYFEHLRNVALILIDECKITDTNMLVASLLHDSGEDTPIFGNSTKTYEEWKQKSMFRLSKTFNPEVAEMVLALTKTNNEIDFKSKTEAHHFYIDNLKKASPKTRLIKMADRLHNLRTLAGSSPEFIEKQLKETQEVYFPIFEDLTNSYSVEAKYMLEKMEEVIQQLSQKQE